ncbi:MAG: hypothetical protein F4Y63_09985 [Chloroflexi bacterium]|nr:hypothetical protein [Chloroflexota bacterium]MYK62148.1 hypothetical protein [Chloroflexota bacterium]
MSGAGTSGTELAKNDDSRDSSLGRLNSRIVHDAAAGTYTAEATTYSSRRMGDFTIRIDAAPDGTAPPSAPRNVRVVPGNNRLIELWDAQASDGGSAIAGYRVEQQAASGSQSRSIVGPSRDLPGAGARGYAILDLTNGTSYTVTVKAANANGDGAPSAATATPQATTVSIGTVHPNPLVLARKSTVKVTTSNTVSGVDYSAELVIQDTDKIRFGACDDDRSTQPLPKLGSTVRIQACETGTPTISARLLVSDVANRTYTVAESVRRRVTVEAAPEGIEIDETGILDDALEINTDRQFSIKGTDLLTGTTYAVEVDVTSGSPNPLGVDSGCANTSSSMNLVTGSAETEKSSSFRLYACAPVTDGEVTAELKLDDVVVATATKTVNANVRASVPTNIRANGHSTSSGSTSGRIRIRVDRQSIETVYKVRYELCTSADDYCRNRPQDTDWDLSDIVRTPTRQTFTVASQTVEADEIVIDQLAMNAVYRVEVAVFPVGVPNLSSAYANVPLLVDTSSSPPAKSGSDFPRIASVTVDGYWSLRTYLPKICDSTFSIKSSDYLPLVQAAVQSWNGVGNWIVNSSGTNDNCMFDYQSPSNDACVTNPERSTIGATEIRMAANNAEFRKFSPDTSEASTYVRGTDDAATGMLRISKAPVVLRPVYPNLNWLAETNGCKWLQAVSAHEIGHAIGARADHSSSVNTLMKPRPAGICVPQSMDKVAIESLYQSR